MTLQAVVESLENVPENLHALYKEDKLGGFRLDVAGVEFPDEIAGLKSALQKERAERERLTKTYRDIDPEEFAKLRDEAEGRQLSDAEAAQKYEEAKGRLLEKHAKERTTLEADRDGLRGQLETVLRTDRIRADLDKGGAIATALLPHVEKRVAMVQGEDGTLQAVATGLDGETKTVSELIAEMKESGDFAWGFAASGAQGGGSAGSRGAGGAGTIRTNADLKTPAAKAAFIHEHGLDAFKALPRE